MKNSIFKNEIINKVTAICNVLFGVYTIILNGVWYPRGKGDAILIVILLSFIIIMVTSIIINFALMIKNRKNKVLLTAHIMYIICSIIGFFISAEKEISLIFLIIAIISGIVIFIQAFKSSTDEKGNEVLIIILSTVILLQILSIITVLFRVGIGQWDFRY